MDIPIQTILKKMEEEIKLVMTKHDQQEIREHVRSIQTLCSVVLDMKANPIVEKVSAAPIFTKKIEDTIEDQDGNGDSIFDF